MKKIFDFIARSRFWEYFYLGFLSFIFFTGVIASLIWKENVGAMLWLAEYREDICIYLARFYLIREFLSMLIYIIENKGIRKDNYLEILKKICLFIVVFLVYYGTKRKIYAIYALLVMKGTETSFDSVMKSYIFSKGAGIVLWVFSYLTGLLTVIDYGRGYTFGMGHYNDAAFTICFFLVALWYVYGQKKNVTFTIIFLAVAIFCYTPINSRTAALTTVIMAFMIWLIKPLFKDEKFKTFGKYLFKIFPLFMLLSAIAIGIYIYKYGVILDGNMSARFVEIPLSYLEEGVHLVANSSAEIFNKYVFDNTYANFIFKRGLIFTVLAMMELTLCCNKIANNMDYGLITVGLYLFIYGQMEYVVKGELLLVFAIYYFCKTIKKEETD